MLRNWPVAVRLRMSQRLYDVLHYTVAVTSQVSPLSLRLGSDGLDALDEIARSRGISRSEAARQAIAETAERERRRVGLRAEALALARDPTYVREVLEVASLMEQLRGQR
jgi:predicted transcriptional regulator